MSARKHDNTKVLHKLTKLRHRFMGELRERLEQCTSVSSAASPELMDLATEGEVDDMTARIAEADAAKIEEIEEALTMLREGSYGVCRNCGNKIRKRRLRAIPFATLCIDCKRSQEQQLMAIHGADRRRQRSADVDIDLTERGEPEEPNLQDAYKEAETSDIY